VIKAHSPLALNCSTYQMLDVLFLNNDQIFMTNSRYASHINRLLKHAILTSRFNSKEGLFVAIRRLLRIRRLTGIYSQNLSLSVLLHLMKVKWIRVLRIWETPFISGRRKIALWSLICILIHQRKTNYYFK
jgi:hypothetical protein